MSEWISVKDRLPDNNGKYLCADTVDGYMSILSFAKSLKAIDEYDLPKEESGWYKYDGEYGYYEIEDITHWMPLPELPKE